MPQLHVYILEKSDYYTRLLKKVFYNVRNMAEIKLQTFNNPSEFFNRKADNTEKGVLLFVEYEFLQSHWMDYTRRINSLKEHIRTILFFKKQPQEEILFRLGEANIYDFINFPILYQELDFHVRQYTHSILTYLDNQRLNHFIQLQADRINGVMQELRTLREDKKNILEKFSEEKAEVETSNKDMRYQLLKILFNVLEVYYPYFGSHAKRVSLLARLIAEKSQVKDTIIEEIEIAGLLHDIGMISVPIQLMTTPFSQMSKDEVDIVKCHPLIGADIFSNFSFLKNTRKYIRHHHEYYNGSGFPDGLRGGDIPLGARIIMIADAYDEISHHGVFMRKPSRIEAINHIIKRKDLQFDPRLVTFFVEVLHDLKAQKTKEREVSFKELEEEMVLAADIHTRAGVFILAKGTILNKMFLTKLEYYLRSNSIENKFYILEESEALSLDKTLISKLSLLEPDIDLIKEVEAL